VTRVQRGGAWAVHLFTAMGIVAAMLALVDIQNDRPSWAIIWMMITLLIDGVDGPIARALEVERVIPRIDGFLLDLIIDYVTCVIVPACFMYAFGVVPQNRWGIAVLCVMVLTSAIWFARKDMMTEDNWFRGFPAAWNIMAPIMWLLDARTWVGVVLTLILSVWQLTNMPYPHIARAEWARPWIIINAVLWIGGVVVGTLAFPDHYLPGGNAHNVTFYIVRTMLYAGCVSFVALALARSWRDYNVRKASDSPVSG
jgi:phosphatidylcholine synthase